MKKIKGLSTMVAIVALVMCMCGMVFGYAHIDLWLQGKTIRPGRNFYGEVIFETTQNENVSMSPYYTSIEEDGSCEVGAYRVGSGEYVKYNSRTKTINADADSGFIPYSIYLDAHDDYKAFIRTTDTKMYLQYLRVDHD